MNKQTVLITGANKGIGLETARKLAKAGYHVFLGCRDKGKGEQAIEMLHTEGLIDIELIEIDVTNEESVIRAHKQIAQHSSKLDILVNNAGILGLVPQLPSAADDANI